MIKRLLPLFLIMIMIVSKIIEWGGYVKASETDDKKSVTLSLTDDGHAFAPTVDVNGHIASIIYTPNECQKVMNDFAAKGFERVYFVTTRSGVPGASSAANQWNGINGTNHITETLIYSGDANFAFVYACHKAGMEAIAVYKPYESGGITSPHGTSVPAGLYSEETIGGVMTGFDSFTGLHPEYRLKRKNNKNGSALINDTVTKIDVAFILDAFTVNGWTGSDKNYAEISDEKASTPEIKLYVSEDNGRYHEYTGNYQVSYKIELLDYLDENGWKLFENKTRCLVATIESISIGNEYKYFALVLGNNEKMYTIPQSMINIYNSEGKVIPSTSSTYSRKPRGNTDISRSNSYVWGDEGTPIATTSLEAKKYFENWGFEFDWNGIGNSSQAFINAHIYGIARGEYEYAKGTLCEAYDEVREYWLFEINYFLSMGYDGIEIRLQNHSNMYSDYAYFGFNEPIIKAYKDKYGEDISQVDTVTKEIAYRIACIRGEFFTDFFTEASQLVHSKGKMFAMHVRSAMIDTSLDKVMDAALHKMFSWAMPKIVFDWKQAIDVCDEVTIKENWNNQYVKSRVAELTEYATEKGKKVWVTAYLAQTPYSEDGHNIGEMNQYFIKGVFKDKNVHGVVFYEYDPLGKNFEYAVNKVITYFEYKPRAKANG